MIGFVLVGMTTPADANASSGGKSSSKSSSEARGATGRKTQTKTKTKTTRRSLLDQHNDPPSQRLATIIRDRERSGPGWIGTAFLIALLSRHDLSSADREWIGRRIASLHGTETEGDPAWLAPVSPVVRFQYSGLQSEYSSGVPAELTVWAEHAGVAVPLECALAGVSPIAFAGKRVRISWTPVAGVTILTCTAGKHVARTLIRSVET